MGDLCFWTGIQREHSSFSRRVIYQVISKKATPGGILSTHEYELRVAFDFENPVGTAVGATQTMWDKEMKRLSLIDLGIIRMYFDAFVRDWARQQGEDT